MTVLLLWLSMLLIIGVFLVLRATDTICFSIHVGSRVPSFGKDCSLG